MVINIQIYETRPGKSPFLDWLNKLDRTERAVIRNRLDRIEAGNLSNCKPIVGFPDLWEIVIDYGPGYRIYHTKEGNKIILILVGGKKGSQKRDIEKAARYLADYQGENK